MTYYDFFSIFNNPSTFATSHTKLIHGMSEAEIKYLPFLPNQQLQSLGLLFSKGGRFFTSMSLLSSWKSLSEVERHSLLLQTPCVEGRMDTAKSIPWSFTSPFNVLLDSKWFGTYPYGYCTHFSSSQTNTTWSGSSLPENQAPVKYLKLVTKKLLLNT